MKQNNSKRKALIPSGIWCITSVVVLFGYLGMVMGVPTCSTPSCARRTTCCSTPYSIL